MQRPEKPCGIGFKTDVTRPSDAHAAQTLRASSEDSGPTSPAVKDPVFALVYHLPLRAFVKSRQAAGVRLKPASKHVDNGQPRRTLDGALHA